MKQLLAVVCCLTGLGLAGHATAQEAGNKPTIAVIPKGTTHEFWKSVHGGAVKASREFNVEIIWKGPLKEDDRDGQISVMEDFITRKVKGIAIAPLDDSALRPVIKEAMATEIPVVIFDSGIKGNDYVSFVATDNFKGGQMAGEALAKLLNGKGKVAMLRYQEGSASTMEREKGFLDAIKKHPGIQVVSENQYGGATTESAQKASENMLAPLKNGDKLTIDGIYACNESTTFGMLRALQDQGLAGKVKFVGFDASSKLIEALTSGQIDALVVQNPMKMGYLAVKAVAEKLKGGTPEKRVDTGATLVTKADMEKPEIKELLNPDLDKWLK